MKAEQKNKGKDRAYAIYSSIPYVNPIFSSVTLKWMNC